MYEYALNPHGNSCIYNLICCSCARVYLYEGESRVADWEDMNEDKK